MNTVESSQDPKIDILLSTYNGALYLPQLLDSLWRQTYTNWQLIIRDDGSTDQTCQIIKRVVKRDSSRIVLIEDQCGNVGSMGSFATLMNHSDADYVMFCDQDDVWIDTKIESMLTAFLSLENGKHDLPLLLHTDLVVVDQERNLVHSSFWNYQKLNPNNNTPNRLLIQNVVTGCTMMINRSLKELALPIGEGAIMHDWWIALVAAQFGQIHYLSSQTVFYRQHQKNRIGAQKYALRNGIRKLKTSYLSIFAVISQANEFFHQYASDLNQHQQNMLKDFSTIMKKRRLERIFCLRRYDLKKNGILRNIGFYITLFFMKREETDDENC